MEKYNYFEAVKEDVKRYIEENYDTEEIRERFEEDEDEVSEDLYEDMWIADSVTGNASGSYTFSTWKAEENLAHNLDLIEEVADYFGSEPIIGTDWEHGAEWWDVNIRCYYLSSAISEALEEMCEA